MNQVVDPVASILFAGIHYSHHGFIQKRNSWHLTDGVIGRTIFNLNPLCEVAIGP